MATYGIDYLGGAAFADLVISAHKAGWAAGFFAEEFGNAYPVVRRLARSGKAPVIRVHALWDAGHRYGSAAQQERVRNSLRKLCAIAKAFPAVQFYFSPYCEHNLKATEMEKTLAICRTVIKNQKVNNVLLVNCVWKGEVVQADDVLNEVHGEHAAPKGKYIYSFDGLDCYNANTQTLKTKYAKAAVFFFWTISMNLKKKDSEKLTVAQRLARSYRPKAVHIEAMQAMAAAKGTTNVPSTITIKPMSEDCGDLKSNKLLVLLGTKYSTVKLLRNNAQKTEVATLKRYDPPTGKQYRYYAAQAGYCYGKKNLVLVQADGKILSHEGKYVLFNPIFRDGTYRM